MLMLTLFTLIYTMIWEIKKQEWKRIGMEEKIFSDFYIRQKTLLLY
jgi:hypothetical protein